MACPLCSRTPSKISRLSLLPGGRRHWVEIAYISECAQSRRRRRECNPALPGWCLTDLARIDTGTGVASWWRGLRAARFQNSVIFGFPVHRSLSLRSKPLCKCCFGSDQPCITPLGHARASRPTSLESLAYPSLLMRSFPSLSASAIHPGACVYLQPPAPGLWPETADYQADGPHWPSRLQASSGLSSGARAQRRRRFFAHTPARLQILAWCALPHLCQRLIHKLNAFDAGQPLHHTAISSDQLLHIGSSVDLYRRLYLRLTFISARMLRTFSIRSCSTTICSSAWSLSQR